nr:response regulator transcription factor [Alkalicella caledoniensis]
MERKSINILVVDDETEIVNVLKAYLGKEGYTVFTAFDGVEAIEIITNNKIDFIVLDLMLPSLSGEEVCKEIRDTSNVPILMLTAKVEEYERIHGLDIGADDYMTKPFSPKELVARVKAILRRTRVENRSNSMVFEKNHLSIDLDKKEVKKRGLLVELTNTEYKLLLLLSQNQGRVFSRDELVLKVLGYDYEGYDRTIDTHIKNIRHKIEEKDVKYIFTVYGVGYKFVGEKDVK